METFKALVVRKLEGKVTAQLETITDAMLDDGEVLVKVAYSSVNYKDMLATQPGGGVIRHYPMIPGIDMSGEVVESSSPSYAPGHKVLVTGYGLGVSHTGGYSEYVRVPSDWLVTVPDSLDAKQAMIYGTAGFTAAQSVMALERQGMQSNHQPRIVVTGASGGVGSVAIALLKQAGYSNIAAVIRKDYQEAVVRALGATSILRPEDLMVNKTLANQRFDYVLDTVGGDVASQLLSQIQAGGSMTLCGNAAGVQFYTTVLPFILRGVNILGIDSVNVSHQERQAIWHKLANEWRVVDLLYSQEVMLADIHTVLESLQTGQHMGRTVVKIANELN